MIKYLYVLTSDETDYYLEQALMSITSLKMRMSDAFVSLLIDDITEKTLTDKRRNILDIINELKIVKIDSQFNKKARSRWLKTSMRRHIKGDFLYIDCDTVICDDLTDIENPSIILGAVLDRHILIQESRKKKFFQNNDKILGFNASFVSDKHFNSGVIFCRDNPICHSFFDEWHKLWIMGISKKIFIDQPSFNQANINFNKIITEMDGIWNCTIYFGGIVFLVNAKIIHYFATVHNDSYILADYSILRYIKKICIIDDNIKKYLLHPKTSFYLHTELIANKKTIEIIYSRLFKLFKYIYYLKIIRLIDALIDTILFKLKANLKHSKIHK